jgi:hypothetical protein
MTLRTFDVSVIIPKASTNLITNSTPHIDTTGYYALNGTISRVITTTRRDIASIQMAPSTGVGSSVYYVAALTSGVQYSVSVDVKDVSGQTMNLVIYNPSSAVLASSGSWTGNGYWKRKYVTFTADATGNFSFRVTRSAVASVEPFFVDGLQLEVGEVTTYLNGGMYGYLLGETVYGWNGTPWASTSWRSAKTRSGGTYLHISSVAHILAVIGLGMAGISNIAIPSTLGGSYFQTTVVNERAFSIVANIKTTTAAGDYGTIASARKTLINALKPDLVTRKQPLQLIIDQLDDSGAAVAETVQVLAHYESGLEGDGTYNAYLERVSLNFRMFAPYIRQDGNTATALGYQTEVTNANYILMRTGEGIWQAMATGTDNSVRAITVGLDNKIFIGGSFLNLTDANGDRISAWNGTAFSSLGTGANGDVNCLATGADGSIYAGGAFTDLGGASGDYLAKWTGSAWASVAAGINGVVYAIAIGPDGSIYIGGEFTNLGDANGDYIAKWNGFAWVSLGTGANGAVYALAVGPDGSLYAGGGFTAMGGVANTAYIAKWTGSAWVSLGGTGADEDVYTLAFGLDGSLYVGGNFTSIAGLGVNKIARYNGSTWDRMDSIGANNYVSVLKCSPSGNIYAGGIFTSIGGVTSNGIAMWTGSAWVPVDVSLPWVAGTTQALAIAFDVSGQLYVGFTNYGSAYSATVTAANVGSATAYPRVIFTGPGKVYQLKNYTTGKTVYFNLTLLAGEIVTLNLNPQRVGFSSSFRGNIINTILPGSALDWELLPGANSVSAFMYGSTSAASAISMVHQDQYWSLDGAVR